MNYLFYIILTFLFFSCAPKETPPQEDTVDLESLSTPHSDIDMVLFEDPPKKDSEPPSPLQQAPPDEEEKEAPSELVLNAQILPVSEPHSGSPGGSIADTLKVFQCSKLNAEGQGDFFLHILNYRIHQLGAHPLCEVIQVKNLQGEVTKDILAYAHYQRDYCDTYTSKFIDELKQNECVQIITLKPSSNEPQV